MEREKKPRHDEKPLDAAAGGGDKKRPYSPPKIDELGSVLELTRGTGMGRADTPLGTYSVRGV